MHLPAVARLFGALCLLLGVPAAASVSLQDYEDSLSLRGRWMGLTRDVPFPAQWIEDTPEFTYMKTVEGGFAFIRESAETGEKRPAFDQQRLAIALGKALSEPIAALRLPFTEFKYEEAGSVIGLIIDDRRWRCTLTDYVCSEGRFAGRPRGFAVVRDLRVPADNAPQLSPNRKWEALVVDDNLVVRHAGGGEPVVRSRDGSKGHFYDPETIKWSPDSRKIALFKVRPGYARYVTRVISSPAHQLQPDVAVQLYPKPGDAVDLEQPVLFHVESGTAFPVPEAMIPNPYQLRALKWRKDSRSFAFEYTRRGHQQAKLIEVDARSGAARPVVTESASTFIDYYRGFRHDVDEGGAEVIWLSERDGWRHLYLIDGKSGRAKRITSGNWPVRSVLKVDDAKRQVWFTASGMNRGEDPYFTHLYRINFDGTQLTPLTKPGTTHEIALSTDLRYFVDTHSRIDLPPVSELRRASDGSLIRTVETSDVAALEKAGFAPPETFAAKARDGRTDIWGVIYRPQRFDPARKYPVIEEIYAGPQGSFVPKAFWQFGTPAGGGKGANMQALANLGFIVVKVDGMGTANRSKAFHDVAWKNLEDSGFPDRILWHKALASKFAWYDLSRGVGIYGGSAGGQSALNALLHHPDFYAAAVTYAGSYDNRMDKIWWSEQWLGWPIDESYIRASAVENAARLRGNLLLIFGDQDSNVDPSTSLHVVDALIRSGKDFELLQIPGGGHSVGRSARLERYVERRKYDFFVRHLLGQATPDWNALGADDTLGAAPK